LALHNSGQLPLPEVFGDVPPENHKGPMIKYLSSDVPCKLDPHFAKYDPDLYDYLKSLGDGGSTVLGDIHQVFVFQSV
jgi:hypothetical protein